MKDSRVIVTVDLTELEADALAHPFEDLLDPGRSAPRSRKWRRIRRQARQRAFRKLRAQVLMWQKQKAAGIVDRRLS